MRCLQPVRTRARVGVGVVVQPPASLSVPVAMTVLNMMGVCFLLGVDVGGHVDIKTKHTTKCMFYSQ